MSRLVARFGLAPLLVTVLTWTAYAASSVGNLSSDPLTRYLVAESILRDGDLAIPESGLTVPGGEDGDRHYSVFFPGQTLAMLPAAAVAEAGRAILGWSDTRTTEVGTFISSVVIMPGFAGLAVLGLMTILRRLCVSDAAAATAGLLTTFATVHWVWGAAGSEEVIVGTLGAWALLGVLAAQRQLEAGEVALAVRRYGLTGLMLAAGVVHRGTFLPIVVAAVAAAVPALVTHRAMLGSIVVRLIPWFIASVAVASIVPIYNHARFGDPFETGYGVFYASLGGLWDTPPLTGLKGHLISPGKSLFLYSPLLLLLIPAALSPRVWRRLGPIGPALVLALFVHLWIYSRTTYWAGAFGWAVRFHVCMLPLVMVPIAVWIDRRADGLPGRPRPLKAALAALVAVSVLVQLVGLSLNTGLETKQDRGAYRDDDHRIPEEAAWTWAHSPFRLRLINLGDKFTGGLEPPPNDPDYTGDARQYEMLTVWNVFPFRVAATKPGSVEATIGWTLWGSLVAASAFIGWRILRTWPDDVDGPEDAPVSPG